MEHVRSFVTAVKAHEAVLGLALGVVAAVLGLTALMVAVEGLAGLRQQLDQANLIAAQTLAIEAMERAVEDCREATDGAFTRSQVRETLDAAVSDLAAGQYGQINQRIETLRGQLPCHDFLELLRLPIVRDSAS